MFQCVSHSLFSMITGMGAVKSVPVIGEIATVVESTVKIVAAGSCAVVGATDAAKTCAESAGNYIYIYI